MVSNSTSHWYWDHRSSSIISLPNCQLICLGKYWQFLSFQNTKTYIPSLGDVWLGTLKETFSTSRRLWASQPSSLSHRKEQPLKNFKFTVALLHLCRISRDLSSHSIKFDKGDAMGTPPTPYRGISRLITPPTTRGNGKIPVQRKKWSYPQQMKRKIDQSLKMRASLTS